MKNFHCLIVEEAGLLGLATGSWAICSQSFEEMF